ncbi:hypothetical protein [Emticicia sp. BO119]|uniref:hypothetical protein n=1 Tax=Emticicia sp. BO119 TaxID=2757768 RepID=UPI0015F108AA|nr:hypothetical protein [Emticicia sp. BO119]MBA4852048.1 hypothetical protein [Emticicia sp. BO119]
MKPLTSDEAMLVLNFYIQHIIIFIEEYNLWYHKGFKQLPKNFIRNFCNALESQINDFCNPLNKPKDTLSIEELEQLHAGTIEIGQYFEMHFNLAQKPEAVQDSFVEEYNALLKKYQLTKSLEEVMISKK